jgi:phage antirepressor YoqD-like protein
MDNNSIASNFERFDADGLELVVNTDTGLAYASISAAARMLEVDRSTVSKKLTRDKISVIEAEIQTVTGLKTVRLVDSETLYDIAFDYNLLLAKKMGAAGANLYMLKLAGYEPKIVESNQIPQTYAQALLEAGRLAMELELAQSKIEAQAPLVKYAEAVQCSDTSIEIGEFAKMIGTGRNRLFREMREAGIVMKNSTLPYQKFCDAGFFEVSQEITEDGKLIPFALLTGKGQLWLKQRLDRSIATQKAMVAAIAASVTQMSLL